MCVVTYSVCLLSGTARIYIYIHDKGAFYFHHENVYVSTGWVLAQLLETCQRTFYVDWGIPLVFPLESIRQLSRHAKTRRFLWSGVCVCNQFVTRCVKTNSCSQHVASFICVLCFLWSGACLCSQCVASFFLLRLLWSGACGRSQTRSHFYYWNVIRHMICSSY